MKKLSAIERNALYLVILGGINWGIIALFHFNAIDEIFGRARSFKNISTIIYLLIGVAAGYLAMKMGKWGKNEEKEETGKEKSAEAKTDNQR